jgi:hypothetical protein
MVVGLTAKVKQAVLTAVCRNPHPALPRKRGRVIYLQLPGKWGRVIYLQFPPKRERAYLSTG